MKNLVKNLTYEDHAIIHMVLFILYQIALPLPMIPTDDYSIKDAGPHRLFTFHVNVRDDINSEQLAASVDAALTAYRAISSVKPLLYGIEHYPAPWPNWSSAYITVCV